MKQLILSTFLFTTLSINSLSYAADLSGRWSGQVVSKDSDGYTEVFDTAVGISVEDETVWFIEELQNNSFYKVTFEFEKRGQDLFLNGRKVGKIRKDSLIVENAPDLTSGLTHSISIKKVLPDEEKVLYEIKTQFMDVVSTEAGILNPFPIR